MADEKSEPSSVSRSNSSCICSQPSSVRSSNEDWKPTFAEERESATKPAISSANRRSMPLYSVR